MREVNKVLKIICFILWVVTGMGVLFYGDISRYQYLLVWMSNLVFIISNPFD